MDTINPHAVPSDQLRLAEVLGVLWRGRWLVAAVMVLGVAAGLYLALKLPKQYTATAVLSPVSNSSSGSLGDGLSSLVSQFGGLASLAGLNVSGDSKRSESLAVLQ